MDSPLTLIVTNTLDLTADRLVRRLGSANVFRFNRDIWEDYELSITADDFRLANPAGAVVRRSQVAKCLWRKPLSKYELRALPEPSDDARYQEAEVGYVLREIVNLLWRDGRVVLIEPDSHGRMGKLVQLEVARRWFKVPPYEFFFGQRSPRPSGKDRVVKSVSSETVNSQRFLWTTAVEEHRLDPRLPWFVQDRIDAAWDVTIVFVRDRMFAFGLDRRGFRERTLDWREEGASNVRSWQPHALPDELRRNVTGYMREIGLHYGRLDFLHDGGDYHFLEVNSNGEWDWLDPAGEHGLLDKIVEELRPDSPLHGLPPRGSAGAPEQPGNVAPDSAVHATRATI